MIAREKEKLDESQAVVKNSRKASSQKKGQSTSHNKLIGEKGERAAEAFLKRVGYEILERNWTCPAGEADIVARDGETVVFVEVKTRTNLHKGLPSDAVTPQKRNRYERIAAWYLANSEFVNIPVRFDVIGILVVNSSRALLRHYINAFGGGM